MTTDKIERLLQGLYDQGARQLAQALRRPTAGDSDDQERRCCLPPSRARVLTLNPGSWTAGEKRHTATCRRCEQLVRTVGRQMVHPGWWDLLQWDLGRMHDADRQTLRYHLEEGGCRRCLRLLGSAWLRSLADLARTGQGSRDRVEALTAGAVVGFVVLPTTGTAFKARAVHPDSVLRTILHTTEAGELAAVVRAADPSLAGGRIHVEVAGDCTLTAEVLLALEGPGCAGRHTFGRLDDLLPRLGADCALLGVPSGLPL